MSFCDEDVAVNCDECYELSVSDCLPVAITTNLTPLTAYWLICTDKTGARYDVQFTSDANGDFTIDPDNYPTGLFNPYAGKFEFIVSLSDINVTPIEMTIGSLTYSCIIGTWSVTCCNNTYVPPTACETFLDTLSDSEKTCICDNVVALCPDITCADATVENSDQSYQATVASGATLILADTTFEWYLNGVLNTTTTLPSMVNQTFNVNFV